ncbi:MAG: porin, partial [Phascolarctobacterium sp.]|nr:porin [Candidatus Phascolarctobacterium equi]
ADNVDNSGKKKTGKTQYNRFRSRLFVNGEINKNWKYTGMLENNRQMNNEKKEDITLNRAFLNGRIGGLKVEAGRCYFCQSDVTDERGDGIKVGYKFGKVNLTGWALKNYAAFSTDIAKNEYTSTKDSDRVYMVKADAKFGKLGAFAQFWKADLTPAGTEIVEVGLTYPIAKGLALNAQYYNGRGEGAYDGGDKNGWEAGLKYLGAKASKPGSWGAWFTYSDRPVATFIHPSCLTTYGYKEKNWWTADDGYKGFEFGVNYAFAKNIVGTARYLNYEGRENNKTECDTVWAEVVFTF